MLASYLFFESHPYIPNFLFPNKLFLGQLLVSYDNYELEDQYVYDKVRFLCKTSAATPCQFQVWDQKEVESKVLIFEGGLVRGKEGRLRLNQVFEARFGAAEGGLMVVMEELLQHFFI